MRTLHGRVGSADDLLLGDFDLLRLRFLALRNADRQHTILVGRADPVAVDGRRQVERSRELAAEPLAALQPVDGLRRALARQRQDAVLESEMNVLALHLWQIRLDDVLAA